MSVLYFRCSRLPWLIRSSLASGPLAWAFFAVFWNGGFLIPQVADKTRPAGSVFLWWILCYGMSFAFTYKDDAVCYSLSVLVAAVGLYHARNNAQFHQWVPPIAIAAVLYATLVIFISRWESNELRKQAAMAGASGYGGEEGRQTRNDNYRLLRE
ncbi:ATP synthase F0 [Metarhizium guizhouense ARSEF 977]|uniref:ATP synthase F0 n=1 Tax=Metarhizium guizhouense (strain ARSEF 977) TaxID=1276136 RepID=A0A0B4GHF7_METGA|nr:ATP synthase F0 [Metarhizium guizhouense ARSEF 977]